MNIIDTSGITPSKGYPLLANNPNVVVGLDFIQTAIQDIVTRFGLAFSNQNFANPIILNGLTLSGNTIGAGAMYYTVGGNYGEIFVWNAPSGGLITGTPAAYIACSWVPEPTDASPYQTVLSDGSQVSIHNQRTLRFSYSATPNSGNLPDYGQFIPTQIATNASNIATLQAVANVPYRASDRVTSGSIPSTETVLHTITVPDNINNLLAMVNMELGNTSSQQAVGVQIYTGGTVSGHTTGTISGTITGGTLIKGVGQDTDPTTNNTVSITAIVVTNITAGQPITVTIKGGTSGTPVIENSSDFILDGSYV